MADATVTIKVSPFEMRIIEEALKAYSRLCVAGKPELDTEFINKISPTVMRDRVYQLIEDMIK